MRIKRTEVTELTNDINAIIAKIYGVSQSINKNVDIIARELIKLKVLRETCPSTPREVAEELAQKTNAEVVGVIGGVMILYRYSKKLHEGEKKAKK